MEQYSRAIARIAAAQIAQMAGFQGIQDSANEALAEIMLRFISEIGASAHASAEVAGRTMPNILDVLMAFQDLGVSLQELMDFVKKEPEEPFAQPLPMCYPIKMSSRWKTTFGEVEDAPPAHIPTYYPAFPDLHTYKDTPLYQGAERNKLRQREKAEKQRRAGEQALLSLTDRTEAAAWGGSSAPMVNAPGPALQSALREAAGKPRAPNRFLAEAVLDERAASGNTNMEVDGVVKDGIGVGTASMADAVPPTVAGEKVGIALGPAEAPHRQTVEWQEADAEAGGRSQPGTLLEAPFEFAWMSDSRAQALASVTDMGFEDAYVKKEEVEHDGQRKHKHKSKQRRRAEEEDPDTLRAHLLLEAGSEAMALDEDPPL